MPRPLKKTGENLDGVIRRKGLLHFSLCACRFFDAGPWAPECHSFTPTKAGADWILDPVQGLLGGPSIRLPTAAVYWAKIFSAATVLPEL
jgi:hypothetical protein